MAKLGRELLSRDLEERLDLVSWRLALNAEDFGRDAVGDFCDLQGDGLDEGAATVCGQSAEEGFRRLKMVEAGC